MGRGYRKKRRREFVYTSKRNFAIIQFKKRGKDIARLEQYLNTELVLIEEARRLHSSMDSL